ncbi:hypothetical protein N9052_02825, partial [bacterium]|nr:hypothetical protein [bacterium]
VMLEVMPWMGLDWDVAQQQFVEASAATVSGGFYSLKRAQSDLDKWRIDMPPSSVERVMSIVRGTPAGLFYN